MTLKRRANCRRCGERISRDRLHTCGKRREGKSYFSEAVEAALVPLHEMSAEEAIEIQRTPNGLTGEAATKALREWGAGATLDRSRPVPKDIPARDADFLAFVRTCACQCCGRSSYPSEASHHGRHGTSSKATDHGCTALCPSEPDRMGCHRAHHQGQLARVLKERNVVWAARSEAGVPDDMLVAWFLADSNAELLREWCDRKVAA